MFLKSSFNTSGNAYNLQVTGSIAYVVGDAGLFLINISNSNSPTLIGTVSTGNAFYDVQISGSNIAYLASSGYNAGLQIIDFSNLDNATLKGSYFANNYANSLQIIGTTAYLADGVSGFQLVSISNPYLPILKGVYTNGYSSVNDVQVVGNIAYLADNGTDASGLQIINISNAYLPFRVGSLTTYDARDVQVIGSRAYLADGYAGLDIIDISDPSAPYLIGSYENTAGTAYSVDVVGHIAYIADGTAGLQVVDVSNANAPVLKGGYLTSGEARAVQVVGTNAYLADNEGGFQIISVIEFDNVLVGGTGNDVLLGGAGADQLQGNTGNDTASYSTATTSIIASLSSPSSNTGDAKGDTYSSIENLTGGAYADTLTGNSGNNTLTGNAGNDSLIGGAGADQFIGNGDNDTASYTTATLGVIANLSSPSSNTGDAKGDTYSSIENLTGSAYADNLTGNSYSNTLIGGLGGDTLNGGTGNDTYIVDNSNDKINETSTIATETDTVQSSISWTLGANLEKLTLTGTAAINATGNSFANLLIGNTANNTLTGNAGNDTLNGSSGSDSLIGGTGNDTYIVDNSNDKINETSTSLTEIDTVQSSISWTLGTNLEKLSLAGTAAINATGNNLANLLIGNSAVNLLNGSSGNDTLNSGTGNDTLTGGTGKDLFQLTTSANYDRITDFSVVDDTIQLENSVFTKLISTGALPAAEFKIASAATDSNDYILYNSSTGVLSYDADGSGAGKAVQIALLGTHLALSSADFIVS
ncbi:MAG: hypothetical protein WAX77_05405 [Methylococcaceae bacterium]